MSYFLREIIPAGSQIGNENGLQQQEEEEESSRVSKQLSKLLYKCAESQCRAEFLKIPNVMEDSGNNADETNENDAQRALQRLDVLRSKYVVGPPSSFACMAMAKTILARYGELEKKSVETPAKSDDGDGDENEENDQNKNNSNQLVGASLACMLQVLERLSARDSELCAEALDTLLALIQTMNIECLRNENKFSLISMMTVLRNLRRHDNIVASKATACLAALSVASGEPENLLLACEAMICNPLELTVQMPENLRRLLHEIRQKVHRHNGDSSSWTVTRIEDHTIAAAFDIPSLPDSSPDDTPDMDHRLYSAIASNGAFVYVLNYVGLYKLGTGLEETILGKLYAANQSVKASKNCSLMMCNNVLYLRRVHSAQMTMINSDNLGVMGTLATPKISISSALFSDGSSFYHACLSGNSTFTSIQLGENFNEISRKNIRLTDVTFSAFGDTRNAHHLTQYLPANLHTQSVDIYISKDMAFLQSRSGKIFYAGNGTRFGLQDTKTTWMELVLPEPIVQMAAGIGHVVFRSGAGHAWMAGATENDKKRYGRLKRLLPPIRRKIVHVAASGHAYGYVTENGKIFVTDHHGTITNANQIVSGTEWLHAASISLGKSHGVAISRSGHLVTWGLNNLNQCGRGENNEASNPHPPARLQLSKSSTNDVKVSSICCGNFHTVVLAADRRVFTFGSNCHGQLGTGDTKPKNVPQMVSLPSDVVIVQVAAGSNHTVLRSSDGSVYTFGAYSKGQLARQAGDRIGWNAVPTRVPGYGPGNSAFAGWIGAIGDSTIIHSHTALITRSDVINSQIVATKSTLMIIPREAGKDYIAIRRNHNLFEHHSISANALYTAWALEQRYDMLWAYNAAEMRVRAYTAYIKMDPPKSDPLTALSYHSSTEFATPVEANTSKTSSQNLGTQLLSATFSASVMHDAEFWKTALIGPSVGDASPGDGYSAVRRFEGTGGGWGYSAHSIEAIQFKTSREIRIVGIGLYGGRGEYIAKLQLFRLLGNDGDELYVEKITETDETMFECGAYETASLLFAQPVTVQPNQWHVISAKISGPSSDCGANGKRMVECDGVTFWFRNSSVSNNGTDVNVGQIPEIYYQLSMTAESKDEPNNANQQSISLTRVFSSKSINNITPRTLSLLLNILSWSIEKVSDNSFESDEREWAHERAAFLGLITIRLLARSVRTVYSEACSEPNIDYANRLVELHSMLLDIFLMNDCGENNYPFSQILQEAVRLFISLSHCFLGSTLLINAHLIAIMNKTPNLLTMSVIGSIAKMTNITGRLITTNGQIADTFNMYPTLSSLLLKHFNCEPKIVASMASFSNVLRFLFDKVFESTHSFNNSCGQLAEEIIVRVGGELAIPTDSMHGPTVHQTSSRFRRRTATPVWDMTDGCADALAFRVDSEGVRLHGFGVYLPTEPDRRHFIAELVAMSPESARMSSEKWTCLMRVEVDIGCDSVNDEIGSIRFTESVLLSPGITYAIKLSMTRNGKTFCGEGGTTQQRLANGARLFFSGCSLSHNGTTVQRGQIPHLLYSIVDSVANQPQITDTVIFDSFLLLLRLLATKIGASINSEGNVPENGRSLVSRISPHVMVFMERFPDKSLEVMSIIEPLIPMVANINGNSETSQNEEMAESACIPIIVESSHPYKPNTVFSSVVGFNEDVDFMCIRFSSSCETAQFEDQLTIYVGVNGHSYMPVERCYGANDWPIFPLLVPGNSLWLVLETSTSVEGATAEQMFGYHATVSGYATSRRSPNLRLEQELVWLSANACRLLAQLPTNIEKQHHLSIDEDDTRHLFEKHGSLLRKGLSLNHQPTLHELLVKGMPLPAQSVESQFLREFLAAHPSTPAGFLARWLPAGAVVDPSKCQLALSHEEMIVGKPVKIKLSCRDQFDRDVECAGLCVDVTATIVTHNYNLSMTNLSTSALPSSLLIRQNPFQPVILNRQRFMHICAMPAFSNYSIEEIRLGFMSGDLVKDRITLTGSGGILSGVWTPNVPGTYCVDCRVDGHDISHSYNVKVVDASDEKRHKSTAVPTTSKPQCSAQLKTAQTATVPITNVFSGIRMRLGTTLASTPVGVIPRGAVIEFIEEIENDDGKWVRLTDETALLYGCNMGIGQVWCLVYHRALRRQLIPLGDSDEKDTMVKLKRKRKEVSCEEEEEASRRNTVSIDTHETYVLSGTETIPVYWRPIPDSIISGETITGPTEIESSGWLANRFGFWIKIAGAEKYIHQTSHPSNESTEQSLTFSTNGNEEIVTTRASDRNQLPRALQPSVADSCRAVFAAFVWHEHLVKDLMAAATYLKFHQNLYNIWNGCDNPSATSAPAALQPIVKIWREICETVEISVRQHLIMPSVSNKMLTSESAKKRDASNGGCELCEDSFKVPITVHLRMAHPGCGADCQGYGYNSNGKFTSGWSGECGTGGRGQSAWYLMCNNCRSDYLRKTPAGHHLERTKRWREFRFSTSAADARPQVIIRQNALFLLDLNNRIHLASESGASSSYTSGWTINLFPNNKSSFVGTLPAAHSSDPGPETLSATYVEHATASLNRHQPTEVLQSPSAALRTLFCSAAPSTAALLKRPVLAFCVEHHNLKSLRAACSQAVRRAVGFSHSFRVWNWLLRMVSSEISVSDVILQYLTALTSYNQLSEYSSAASRKKKNSMILPHPWRLCFLAGPIAAEMVTQLHAFLHTISIILQSNGVDGRLRSLCFNAWTLQLTAQEQDLLILTCNILATVGGVLSDTSVNDLSRIEMKNDVDVKEMMDITKHTKISASSRQAMVICLTDGSGETFWESGDEDKNRARSLSVQIGEDANGVLLTLFIDNIRDDGYRVTSVVFRAIEDDGTRKELNAVTLENNYCGWLKCCIATVRHVHIMLKGASHASRVRQLTVLGFADSRSDDSGQQIQAIHPSTSHHLFFSETQRDAFALFQAICSQAFCGELSQDETLRERVIDLLFSRIQLYPLQNYVYNQVVQAIDREVELLCHNAKRNYSYCCGLMGLLVRICDSSVPTSDIFSQRNTILTSMTQLLIFAPTIVQRQCINSLECIFSSFSPTQVETSKVIRNLLIVVGKVIQLQIRDKAAHTVVTVYLCTSVANAPPNWRIDKDVDGDIGRQTAQLINNLCDGSYSAEWASTTKSELANCLLTFLQLPESLSCSDQVERHKGADVVASKRFWLAISALSLIRDKSWLEQSDRWRVAQEQVVDEPLTMCENHDDDRTLAQVFCHDCDVALCKECFTVMHLHKKNRNHGVQNLAQSKAQHDINIHHGCARLKLLNLLVLFYGEALNGMVEVTNEHMFPSISQTNAVVPMQTSTTSVNAPVPVLQSSCRFCGNKLTAEEMNLNNTCSHEDCINYSKSACQNIHPECGHYCAGIRDEETCMPCLRCASQQQQDADDVCVVCFTERLGAAPCVRLECEHIFHYHCVRMILERRWNGPRIVFRFMHCPLCMKEIIHPGLNDLIKPLLDIKQQVTDKARMRLEYDGLLQSPAIVDPRSEFYNQPEEYALDRYMYVLCFKCKKVYFGGESRCQAALDTSQHNPEELICGACSDTSGVQVCPRHGVEYLEYKCRFCCSIAVYFCFGTTHFCAPCHDDFQRLMTLPKNLLPACPVGPRATPMEGQSCPLKMNHPPTGEEFAMGCGICRNISTF